MFSFNVIDPSVCNKIEDFVLPVVEAFNATSGLDDLHICVSHAHGTEGLDPMYGADKLPQLLNMKQKRDLKGVFRYNNALPK